MIIEGVRYYRFRATFRLTNGARRRRTFRSPGYPWVRTEIARALDEEFGIENIASGSVRIQESGE